VSESHVQAESQRRSQRVQIAVPVVVRGADFREETSTVTVNAHGGLVMLKARVARGNQIWLANPKTGEELPVKVVFLGNPKDGKTPVGIEFNEPSPLFWKINFPPKDWASSAERKRAGSNPPPNRT
jgi:hypothetical protein